MEFMPDIPRLFTAVSEWAACLIYIFFLKKKIKGIKLYSVIALFLAVFCIFQILAGAMPIYLWVVGMAMAVVLMYLFIYICCDISPISAGCWCAQAFVIAEFVAALEWQLYSYFVADIIFKSEFSLLFVKGFTALIIFALAFGLFFIIESRYMKISEIHENSKKEFLIVVSIVLGVFVLSNMSYITPNTPFSGNYTSEIFYIRTLVDLCGIILLISQREQKLWAYAKNEISSMEMLLVNQYEQYKREKESIDVINRKHHDLKHQIAVIRAEKNIDKKTRYIDNLESSIKMYESQYKTGNNVLDVVLAGKSMVCLENNINFTCVVDGTLLNFMEVMDLCSVFGNALDNAIESVKKIKDKEKRIIKIAVYNQGELLMIKIENYFESKLQYNNNELITTKNDKNNHGYGIKSIKYITEKYHGSLNIAEKDQWFVLSILIPINQV